MIRCFILPRPISVMPSSTVLQMGNSIVFCTRRLALIIQSESNAVLTQYLCSLVQPVHHMRKPCLRRRVHSEHCQILEMCLTSSWHESPEEETALPDSRVCSSTMPPSSFTTSSEPMNATRTSPTAPRIWIFRRSMDTVWKCRRKCETESSNSVFSNQTRSQKTDFYGSRQECALCLSCTIDITISPQRS